ncbi:hypothetical protein SEUBUCD646_0O00790 [Saccharomyces eubayanus]|uniref:Autophagy protein Atg19/Atg34 C-terminal domain-containing protein n=1 Tax=Saccharomyces eubayanus TaxID=1080349 RepID=A0ABN8VKB1_SACEU|nr:hypothetical protein SEUBUCD650_0O00840 [Saccharomyces eubayanus]CAI1741190.1 hypothetical protein SEUBUCD646_0O00790 [Saccharomyces eubayanus]
MTTPKGHLLTVCDEHNRLNLIMPSLDADAIFECMGQCSMLNDATRSKHLFWQPSNKSNVRILLNGQDYGHLFKHLQSQIHCTIYIGEEALKKYGLTITTYFDNFLDKRVSGEKENSSIVYNHETATSSEAKSSEATTTESTAGVIVPRECLNSFTEQLSRLEESLNKMELEQKATTTTILASGEPDYKISGTIDIPEDKPELVHFFTQLKTVKQLEDVFQRYHSYKNLLDTFGGKMENINNLLQQETVICQDPEPRSDRSLQVTMNHRDSSLYFQLYNNTTSILAGNCKFNFTGGDHTPVTRTIDMGPHEIGIKERKEFRYFPYTPELMTASTIEIENEYGEVIFVGKRGPSPRVDLKPPTRLSAESLQASQEPFYDFRIGRLPELDDSSIISTSISLSCDDEDDENRTISTFGKVLTWEEL